MTSDQWQPIETAPTEPTMIRVRYANGVEAICPAPIRNEEITRRERRELVKSGVWPDFKNWRITHWAPTDRSQPCP